MWRPMWPASSACRLSFGLGHKLCAMYESRLSTLGAGNEPLACFVRPSRSAKTDGWQK